jgi:S-adenosylmethionine decarboxylase
LIEGTHIVLDLKAKHADALCDASGFAAFIQDQIRKAELTNVGEIKHEFNNGGFTMVVALAESHLSVHTWPEKDLVAFDIFVSNYSKNNAPACERICHAVVDYFKAEIIQQKAIKRFNV